MADRDLVTAETGHTLIVHEDERVTLECHGVTESCRCWIECRKCEDPDGLIERWYDDEDADQHHGERHKVIECGWFVETNLCLTMCSIDSNAYDLVSDNDLGPGRYPVEFSDFEEGFATFTLLTTPPASESGGDRG